MSNWITVARAGEIPINGTKRFVQGTYKLLIIHTADGYFVIDDTCTHAESSLSEGYLSDGEIECGMHGGKFDIITGEVRALPAVTPLHTYHTVVENDAINVELE